MRSILARLLAAAVAAPLAAFAQTLTIGLAADVTSIDPHFHVLGPNQNIAEHVFETLVAKDARQKLKPGLAESWRALDDTTWEVKLRRGVKFHDGSDFTADDVVFSLARPETIRNSPSSFTVYTKAITGTQVVDPYTVRLYHQVNAWATRKGIGYTPRTDERTYAFELKPR